MFECLFDTARQPVGVWSFSHNSNQIFSHYPFVLAFLGENVLLTAKIKKHDSSGSTIGWKSASKVDLQLMNKSVQICNWNLTAVDKTLMLGFFLLRFSAAFVSISTRTTLHKSRSNISSDFECFCNLLKKILFETRQVVLRQWLRRHGNIQDLAKIRVKRG